MINQSYASVKQERDIDVKENSNNKSFDRHIADPRRCLSWKYFLKWMVNSKDDDDQTVNSKATENRSKTLDSNQPTSIRSNGTVHTIMDSGDTDFPDSSISESNLPMESFCEDGSIEDETINGDVKDSSKSDTKTIPMVEHYTGTGFSVISSSVLSSHGTNIPSEQSEVFDALPSSIQVRDRSRKWFSEFRRTDPRYQILSFFDEVAFEGDNNLERNVCQSEVTSSMVNPFYNASVFTVWRPTSFAAIRKMMVGEAVGKGLDIKGKSAKRGSLSGFVPFLQIHEEKDKKRVHTISRVAKPRIFFASEQARSLVLDKLQVLLEEMVDAVRVAKEGLQTDASFDEKVAFTNTLRWEMSDPSIDKVDDYGPKSFGLDVPERLFWEAYVTRQDITRPTGSDYDSGRPSEPNFQDMNTVALRRVPQENQPRAVLFQHSTDNPMCPQGLLMAYEESGRVLPVVSDFDCFLTGTRGIKYKEPFAPEQQAVMNWCVSKIEEILNVDRDESWTSRWLEKIMHSAASGYYPASPEFGFSDPKSYKIMETGIKRLQACSGPVRHGAESFNYCFPQELDKQFLVISGNLAGHSLPWKYVDASGLQEILLEKIDKGFTFPLNPKWILCDPGWKRVYDKLLSSDFPNVQNSLDIWYPLPIREKIEEIHQMRPDGFKRNRDPENSTMNNSRRRLSIIKTMVLMGAFTQNFIVEEEPDDAGSYLMANAEQELKRYMTLRRAKLKLRIAIRMMNMINTREEKKDDGIITS